jgi:hypothetical protein
LALWRVWSGWAGWCAAGRGSAHRPPLSSHCRLHWSSPFPHASYHAGRLIPPGMAHGGGGRMEGAERGGSRSAGRRRVAAGGQLGHFGEKGLRITVRHGLIREPNALPSGWREQGTRRCTEDTFCPSLLLSLCLSVCCGTVRAKPSQPASRAQGSEDLCERFSMRSCHAQRAPPCRRRRPTHTNARRCL